LGQRLSCLIRAYSQITRYNTSHDATLIANDKNKLLRGKPVEQQPQEPSTEVGATLQCNLH
jgi:hypothetical protein